LIYFLLGHLDNDKRANSGYRMKTCKVSPAWEQGRTLRVQEPSAVVTSTMTKSVGWVERSETHQTATYLLWWLVEMDESTHRRRDPPLLPSAVK
jgi:hypothetical protein